MTHLRRILCLAVFAAVATLLVTRPALVRGQSGTPVVITPGAAVPVTSPRITINNDSNDHSDPHVSGDLAAYTEFTSTPSIHYYRFSTAVDQAIPSPAGATDGLSDVRDNRIVFSRGVNGCDRMLLFDVATASVSEVGPPAPCPQRFNAAIGGKTVAYTDFATGVGAIFASDLSSPGPGFGTVQLSSAASISESPEVAPSGNVVVWAQCVSLTNCDVMASVFNPAPANTWNSSLVTNLASNPDTDGTWIVYDATRAGNLTGRDIYFKPVAGGVERQLAIAGEQADPSIRAGVIAFESRPTAVAPADIFVYAIATDTLYQVTNTPSINEALTDVDVLPNGDVRVVWVANDGLGGVNNVYATTFTPAKPSQIAFASTRDGNSEIYVMDKDGSNQKRLTNNPAFDGLPAWSPERTKIAFVSNRDGVQQIYVMNADGSNQTRLSSALVSESFPAWSPDGAKIVFTSARNGNLQIYVMNADGTNPTRLTVNQAFDVTPAWSRDGTKIAFASNRDGGGFNFGIYVMNSDGSNPTRLTNNAAADFDPTWSPDGSHIAFTSTRDGSLQIYSMNADGSSQTRLTNVPGPPNTSVEFSEPSWSPHGDIAVTRTTFAFNSPVFFPPDFAIYSLRPDGTFTRLSGPAPARDSSPDW